MHECNHGELVTRAAFMHHDYHKLLCISQTLGEWTLFNKRHHNFLVPPWDESPFFCLPPNDSGTLFCLKLFHAWKILGFYYCFVLLYLRREFTQHCQTKTEKRKLVCSFFPLKNTKCTSKITLLKSHLARHAETLASTSQPQGKLLSVSPLEKA